MRGAIVLLLVFTCLSQGAAEDAPRLRVDDKDVVLPGGLQRTADGRTWITASDLRRALDVIVKPVIPRPPQGRKPDRRREREGWLLCGLEACETYRGEVTGIAADPAFELAKVAKLLGMRHRVKGSVHDVQTPRGRWSVPTPKRARMGRLLPNVELTFMDGGTHRIREARGKRLLLVTWASWSPTRTLLDPWRSAIVQRASKDVILVLAAIDVEGEEHVRNYAQFAGATNVAIDRHATLARHLPMTDVGHWYYIDELGVLRAEGKRPDADALAWIDLLLAETPTPREPTPPGRTPRVDLTVLRERADAEPKRAEPLLALLAALKGSEHAAERLKRTKDLVAAHPKVAPFAFRLAALHLEAGDRPSAIAVLDEARRRVPKAWYLRKQYWALWQPNRYYAGPIDTAWEREQRKQEEKEFGNPGRRGRRR